MESKLLYTIGNVYTGYPWGVEAERQFGTVDLYGPFNTENRANTFAHELIAEKAPDGMPYQRVKIVKLETPQASGSVEIERAKDGGVAGTGYKYAAWE